MNIIERAREWRQSLRRLAQRSRWDWRRCPQCGQERTQRWGHYTRRPWSFGGRQTVPVQRHRCLDCQRTYSEQSALLVRGSWYAREVHRSAVDHWQHGGLSLRRTAEFLRSWLGRQERWLQWRPLDSAPLESCTLTASTVQRWLDAAGCVAQASVAEQLAGLATPQALGTDGLWAKLRCGTQRVVLLLVDSVSGLLYPPVLALDETSRRAWQRLFERAQQAGLVVATVRSVTSDGAQGLLGYLPCGMGWVLQQRCVWHIWRNLRDRFAQAARNAAAGLSGAPAEQVRRQTRAELGSLVRQVIDAPSHTQAEAALATLQGHPWGATLAKLLNEQFDHLLLHLLAYYHGLVRVAPEWCWRDFRLRLSHGRNHGSDQRLERAALVWAIYHNFEPAQRRSERQRHYRHPGQSALHVAGASPGQLSYLDALGV
jgi:transposase-like protein